MHHAPSALTPALATLQLHLLSSLPRSRSPPLPLSVPSGLRPQDAIPTSPSIAQSSDPPLLFSAFASHTSCLVTDRKYYARVPHLIAPLGKRNQTTPSKRQSN